MWIALSGIGGIIVGVFGTYYFNTYRGDGLWD